MQSKITYRQQYTRCGKQNCRKCREGAGHGPYWYGYKNVDGHTVSKYIGKTLPPEIVAEREAASKTRQENTSSSHQALFIAPTLLLRVYLFGQFRIERKVRNEWKGVENSLLSRRRARMLLGCLLSSPTRRLGREQVMEYLWPELDNDTAANRLNGAVHELRRALEPELDRPATSKILKVSKDILELADNSLLWVDVEEFENLLKQVDASHTSHKGMSKSVEQLLTMADMLYSDGYLLEEMYANWVTFRRDALQRRWIGVLLQLADLHVQNGAFASAVETLDRLRAAEPTNETALQKLMRLLARLNRRGEALHIYRQYVAMLSREYEADPLQETQALYAELCGETAALVDPTILQSQQRALHSQEDTALIQRAKPSTYFTRPVFQSGRHNQSTLVGREHEKEEMSRLLDDIGSQKSKRPHFLLLSGQSGIGKTRLAEELSEEAYSNDWSVVWSRAYEQESNVAYHVWMSISRILIQCLKYPSVLSQNSPSSYSYADMFSTHMQVERLGVSQSKEAMNMSASSSLLFPAHEQDRLYLREAMVTFLVDLSNKHPILIVLDDLQWADESSIELLTYLVHHLQEHQVLIVGTYRESELQPTHTLQALIHELQSRNELVALKIQPLSKEHIQELVSRHSIQTIERIQKLSAGNPFFAEELARSAEADRNSELRFLPDTISALLERRLHRLSNECQIILSRAAVLGRSFHLHYLLLMSSDYSEEVILALLEEALNERLITDEREGAQIVYHFWHPLINHHLYERLSATRKIQLHKRAADVIKSSKVEASLSHAPAQIAFHLFKSGGDAKEIVYYAEIAGNQAYSISAYHEAQYSYVLALLTLVGLTETENPSNSKLMQYITTERSQNSTVTSQEDEQAISHLLELAAECSFHLGSFADARGLYMYALELREKESARICDNAPYAEKMLFQRREAQIQALIWREIVFTYIAIGEYDLAQEGCKKGKAVLSSVDETNCIAWASLQLALGEISRCKGLYKEAKEDSVEALFLLDTIISPATPTASSSIQNDKNEMSGKKAQSTLHRQTKTEKTLRGDIEILAYANEQLGVIKGSIGQIDEALNYLKFALQKYEELKQTSEIARVCGNLGAVLISKSAFKEAKDYLDRAYSLAEHSGNRTNLAFIVGNLGDLANYSGNLREAEKYYKESVVLAEQIDDREHVSWHYVLLADVQQDLGNFSASATNLLHALRIGRAINNSRCIHFALVSLGELRLIEAIIEEQKPHQDDTSRKRSQAKAQKFLQRAKYAFNHALSQSGVEIDTVFECKLLLAVTHLLSNNLELSQQIAQQTLEEAQRKNIVRMEGRAKRILAGILSEQHRYDEAEVYFKEAVKDFKKLNIRLDLARTLRLYGSALLNRAAIARTSKVSSQENADHFYERGMRYLVQASTITHELHAAFDHDWSEYLIRKFSIGLPRETNIRQE